MNYILLLNADSFLPGTELVFIQKTNSIPEIKIDRKLLSGRPLTLIDEEFINKKLIKQGKRPIHGWSWYYK